ncbi:phosphotransferase [Sutcliffiella horikoshii]|uniref:Phosphotransferase n=1 Tax=Sutcliffiella horikoshii TaxID=79883 RepID=A0A5D4T005_9BACI|nr:phosphotransferase [Sutcliffiella horikoshii]TYS67436.1 phosphotransferase [Sutcliffiella horikoshii]
MSEQLQFDNEALEWIKRKAKELNLSGISDQETIKATDISLVEKFTFQNATLYFKATGKSSEFEPSLTEELFLRNPKQTVEVIASHSDHPWMLMKELKGESLRKTKDKDCWKNCLQEYAHLQVKESKNLSRLVDIGVPDRRFAILKDEIELHLLDLCQTGLNRSETKQIMDIKEELLKMCDRMENVVPYSLDHGDLHSGNIQVAGNGNEPVFFDWGDAAVSHPFFSTRIFWHALDELIESESEWLDIVNEFKPYYLEPWREFAPLAELEKALELSDQLACVYRALGWHLYITPFRKDKEDSKNKPAQWLRVLLEHRDLVKGK